MLSSVMSSLLPLPAGHREQDRPLSLTSRELAHGGPRTQGGCARVSLKGEVLPSHCRRNLDGRTPLLQGGWGLLPDTSSLPGSPQVPGLSREAWALITFYFFLSL